MKELDRRELDFYNLVTYLNYMNRSLSSRERLKWSSDFVLLFIILGDFWRKSRSFVSNSNAPRSARARPSELRFSAGLDAGGGGFDT